MKPATSELVFTHTTMSVAGGIFFVLVVMALAFLAWRRSGWRTSIGILELLLVRPGAVVSRERILNSVWVVHSDPLTNIVEVYMGRLRRKLNALGPAAIETVRSFGYRLIT